MVLKAIILFGLLATPLAEAESPLPPEIETRWREVAGSSPLWPGFDPIAIPLAVYDGAYTYLFRHPDPPPDFSSSRYGLRMPGRHPAVTANSSAEIGGQMTATVMTNRKSNVDQWVATAMHEAFHVFQREHHPGWSADESAAFLYPVTDPVQLADRRLESAALANALGAANEHDSACWARLAVAHRARRYERLPDSFSGYERANELNEGLASYIGDRVVNRLPEFPPDGWDAEEVRKRLYATGSALAHLLDRFAPGWKEALESDDGQWLDHLLAESLPDSDAQCGFATAQLSAMETRASDDAAQVTRRREAARAAFSARPGRRIRIELPDSAPLWPERFDPWNTRVLDGGTDLLHMRMLRLANEAVEIEMVNTSETRLEAVTVPAGDHPLFNGIRLVEIAGFEDMETTDEDGSVIIEAPGFRARVPAGSISEDGDGLLVEF